jgi:hypothetical protein
MTPLISHLLFGEHPTQRYGRLSPLDAGRKVPERTLGGRRVIGRASEKVHGRCGRRELDSVYDRRPLRTTLYSF